jgi:uncharacterized repeat protein (TIGR03803 family)
VTGYAYSENFPTTPGAFQVAKASPAIGNAFVTKVNPGGTALVYSTYLGGANLGDEHRDYGSAIAVDQLGDAVVTGTEQSDDFPVTSNALQTTDPSVPVGVFDNAFVTKLNPSGTALLYSTYFGGSQDDYGNAIAVDKAGDAFVAGQTFSEDFPTLNAYQGTNPSYTYGGSNAFVAELAIGGETTTALSSNANPQQEGDTVTFTAVVTSAFTEGVPTGSVVFSIDGNAAATVALDATGTAAYSTSALATGAHTIEGAYSGDTNYLASNATLTETIQGPTPATLTAPATGSVLSGAAATTFTWTAGTGASSYELRLGTTGSASDDLYNSGITKVLTETVGPLPASGLTVYATLYSEIAGTWSHTTYTFVESGTPAPAVLTSPAAASVLSGTAATTFTWTAGTGVSSYELRLGTTGSASDNLYNSGFTSALTETVGPLPTGGLTVYATLYSKIGGTWTDNTYTFTESALLPQTESILYQFIGNNADNPDGWHPNGGLVMDSQGDLYGTTSYGPTAGENVGTVFKVSPSGQETILHSFGGAPDGSEPNSGLVMDAQGNLYGTTFGGGSDGISENGFIYQPAAGTVFKIAPDGTETVLHSFPSTATDGESPYQGLAIDSSGNLYGTTELGGNSSGCGTIFKVTPGGAETVLYTFSGPDGCSPGESFSSLSNSEPGLIIDATGNLYGTTAQGGANGAGTVFKLAADGTETVLHSFANSGTDGYEPNGGLALDSAGNLYGSTSAGGTSVFGIIFKIAPSGAESVLFNFNGDGLLWTSPGLALDSHGNLYGTSSGDGAIPGVVFQLAPSGVMTFLHLFPGYPAAGDGTFPQGGLLLAANGSLYGTTSGGEVSSNSGTVFELGPSVNPTAPPVFSVLPGTYTSPQTITISDATPGATIYYFTNGAIASAYAGTVYYNPVTISSTALLSAIAVAPDGTASDPIMANYVITSGP